MRSFPLPFSRRTLLAGLLAACVAPARAAEPLLTFDGLYKSFGVLGYQFADGVLALKGQTVRIRGYMAPPLSAESQFFVLTREPMAICPFCQSDADWPVDIIVIYLAQAEKMLPGGSRLEVTGRLEVGAFTDPATGFVSQIRLRDAQLTTR